MTAVQILQMARELVLRPDAWTKGCSARSASGWPVSIESRLATKFSMLGALRRAELSGANRDPAVLTTIANVIGKRLRYATVANKSCVEMASVVVLLYNETVCHRQIIEILESAIAEIECQRR